jgi:ABC-type transport system involved in cytochrome bd biosynthesis fused ATPase/permease subunit
MLPGSNNRHSQTNTFLKNCALKSNSLFQIIAIKDGKVEEIGTHDQLLAKENGYYAKLVKSQM